jgi:glycosyltransferase involved in cell wall biosynthesis
VTRVVQLYQPTGGGVGRHVRDLAECLSERGQQIMLVGPSPPDGMSRLPAGVSHVPLELGRAVSPAGDLAALGRLSAILRRLKPDLVHTHSSKAGALARVARLARPTMPVVYTPHGYAFAGWFSGAGERLAYREIERALAPLSSRVVCVCEAEARLGRSVGFAKRIRVIHNGIAQVAPGAADPRMLELARKGPVVCVLTQLRPGKGIEALIDATPALAARGHALQVAIWGEGPERETLEDRARRAGVAESVHFLGRSSDPLAALRGADVFVHPSLAESFPYAILEAMAAGAPIVASDVGGIGEALQDGESGMLVPPGSVSALTEAVGELLEDRGRREAMGSSARGRVQRVFTREAMIDRLIGVYHEVCPADMSPR